MPRVFFYVQHLLGIGHLARASGIVAGLVDDGWEVTLALGGTPVAGFPGPGVGIVQLPPVKAAKGFSALVDDAGDPVDDPFRTMRRDTLLSAFAASEADVLIVEAFPFGRRQMRFELLPLLEAARARGIFVACSIRDILQENRKPGRAEETVATVERYFDLVLVHGDPSFARLEETFPLASRIEKKKIAYTGLIAPPRRYPSPEKFDVIVSAGGGAVSGRLLLTAAEATRKIAPVRTCFIMGPNLAAEIRHELGQRLSAGDELRDFYPTLSALLMSAKVSVSQAGYNTVCDLLRAKCRAVLVPYAEGGETEQTLRAERLSKLGLAQIVREDELDAERLADAINAALAAPAPDPKLDLEGDVGTARALRKAWLAARRRRL